MKQRSKSDCGIVAVALACGKTYREVKERFGRIDKGGMLEHEFRWMLSEFANFTVGRSRLSASVFASKNRQGSYALEVESAATLCYGETHMVALVDGVLSEECDGRPIVTVYKICEERS